MTNGEKHIEKLLSWYKEAVTEDGVCYLTSDDQNTLAYAIKCCKHFEDIKEDIDSWGLREEPSGSGIPNKSEIPTGSIDGISRADVNRIICEYRDDAAETGTERGLERAYGANTVGALISELPSVTSQEPFIDKINKMKSEIADSLGFWDYSPNNNPLAKDMLETMTHFWGDVREVEE